jgi:hypothetical protein
MRYSDPSRPDAIVWPSADVPAPAFGEIVITRTPGRVEVVQAPQRARISLAVLTAGCQHEIRVQVNKIMLAEQVVYAVSGYDQDTACLEVVLVEDRRQK